MSAVERMIGIFLSPVETMRDIARRPDFLAALLVIVAVSLACTALVIRHVDFQSDIRASFEESGRKMSAEQSERALKWGVAIGKTAAWAAPALMPLWWAIYAGIVLMLFRMFGADLTFRQSFAVKIYSVLPGLLRGIVIAIVTASRGTIPARSLATIVRSNPGFLADLKTQPVLFALLSQLDVFTIWTVVLSIIGYAFAANVSRTKAAIAIGTLFVIGLFFSVAFAAMGAAMKS